MGAVREGRKQGLVGEDVDPAREPLGRAGDELDRSPVEHLGAAVACGAHAKIDVVLDVAAHQGLQRKAVGDSLLQLAHLGRPQMLIELRLPEEHDLQQLVPVRLEVRQQPDFLQRLLRHRMRLVDQDHHAPALAEKADEMLLQSAQHARRALVLHVELQLVADRKEDFIPRQRRTAEINGFDRWRQALHQHPAQHRLAAADFAGDLDDALVVSDRVEKRLERCAAVGALKEEIRMGRNAEGRLFQPEMVQIHRDPLPARAFSSRPLKNASRVKIDFGASRVSEGSVFQRTPIWGIPRGRSPLFQRPLAPTAASAAIPCGSTA